MILAGNVQSIDAVMLQRFTVLMAAAILAGADPAPGADESAIRKLSEATQIETERIYESATPSQLAQAFSRLLHSPDAKEALVRVFQHAKTDAGRVYGLTGLYAIDRNEYRTRVTQMNPANNVKAMWYDVVRTFTVKDLVKMIETGELAKTVLPKSKP